MYAPTKEPADAECKTLSSNTHLSIRGSLDREVRDGVRENPAVVSHDQAYINPHLHHREREGNMGNSAVDEQGKGGNVILNRNFFLRNKPLSLDSQEAFGESDTVLEEKKTGIINNPHFEYRLHSPKSKTTPDDF